MNKSERKRTESPKVNPLTGLTPVQERTATLLASGEKVSEVASKVQVSRTTIYQWNDLITFKCFMNQLRDEVQKYMNDSLVSMTEDALNVIRQSLTSENEGLRLKSATWLLERMGKVEVGDCNPLNVIRKEVTYIDNDWGMNIDKPTFHAKLYENRLKELGLKDPTPPKADNDEFGWDIGGD